jgi:hypothetical protein
MTDAPTTEYDVRLRIRLEGVPDEQALEELTIQALEAVEEGAADVALGPVASCHFADHAIELDFNVLASTSAHAHHLVGDVASVIEQRLPIAVIGISEDAAQSDRPELVAA